MSSLAIALHIGWRLHGLIALANVLSLMTLWLKISYVVYTIYAYFDGDAGFVETIFRPINHVTGLGLLVGRSTMSTDSDDDAEATGHDEHDTPATVPTPRASDVIGANGSTFVLQDCLTFEESLCYERASREFAAPGVRVVTPVIEEEMLQVVDYHELLRIMTYFMISVLPRQYLLR